jgi:ubiquinone/menaquinone biosynthesis C-methylase UbiE
VQIVALDFLARHLQVAREGSRDCPEITFVQADARQPPFTFAAFDFVISTLFLHHLDEGELVQALGAWAAVCRGTLVLNDLVRGRTPLVLFRNLAPLLARSEITVQDGLVSIARAYRPRELRQILQRAGLPAARLHRDRLYHRMTIVSG